MNGVIVRVYLHEIYFLFQGVEAADGKDNQDCVISLLKNGITVNRLAPTDS